MVKRASIVVSSAEKPGLNHIAEKLLVAQSQNDQDLNVLLPEKKGERKEGFLLYNMQSCYHGTQNKVFLPWVYIKHWPFASY